MFDPPSVLRPPPRGYCGRPPVLGADVLSSGAAVLRKASAPKTRGRTLYPVGGGRDTENGRPLG